MKINILLIILLITLASADDPTPKDTSDAAIKVGESIEGSIVKATGDETVILLKPTEVYPDQYLFLSLELQPLYEWQNVRITIFNKDGNNKLLSCQSIYIDSCFIRGDQITKDDSLNVNIICESDCKYKFNTYWNQIETIGINDVKTLTFQSFGIGRFFELDPLENNFERLEIIVQPNSQTSLLNQLKMIGTLTGKLPTQQQHDLESLPLWGNGHGIFIKKSQITTNKILILVLGEANIEYTLKCIPIINGYHTLELGNRLHDYLDSGEKHKLQMPLPFQKDDGVEEIFTIDVGIYAGQVQIGLFVDSQTKVKFQTDPVLFRGNSRYILNERDLQKNNINTLYITVQSLDYQTTYSVFVAKEYLNEATQLKQSVYEYIELNSKKLFYIKVQQWRFHISQNPQSLIIKVLNSGQNMFDPVFRVCQKSIHECTSLYTYEQSSKVISKVEKIVKGGNTNECIYKINLDPKVYFNILANPQNSIIVVELDVKFQEKSNFIVLEYIDQNQIYNLKELNQFQTSLQIYNTKYFYYKAQNPNIKNIFIHCIPINGMVQIKSAREDPRNNQLAKLTAHPIDKIQFKQPNKPIFLIVTAKTQASFILVVETTNKQPTTDQNDVSEFTPMLEDQQYTLYLNSGQTQLLEIEPKYEGITLTYISTGSISACLVTNSDDKCSENQNSKPIIGNKGVAKIENAKAGSKSYIRVFNTNHKKSIETTLHFHSGESIKCNYKSVGKLYSDVVPNNHCVVYEITDNKDYEGVFMRTQMEKEKITLFLCNNQINIQNTKFSIPNSLIKENCLNVQKKQVKVYISNGNNNDEKLKVQYVLKLKEQPLELPDGISHIDSTKAQKEPLAVYYYYALNKVTTQVLIHNKIGGVLAYVKLVEQGTENPKLVSKTIFDLTTEQQYLYLSGPQIIITEKFFNQAQCINCVLLIAVYSDNEMADTQDVTYSIEVSQNTVLLNEHEVHSSFLYKGTTAYFRYECMEIGNTLIFDVSDQHLECVRIYASNKQYPSPYNKIDMVWGNELSFECKERHYYFALEAITDCPVSVIAQSTQFKMIKIKEGLPLQFNLKNNQVQYFTYSHNINENFKILSLEKYGNVKIYANQATNEILETVKSQTVQFNNFKFKSRMDNMLLISKGHQSYCSHCIYLIAIVAESNIVQSSLFISNNPNQPVLMFPDNVIYDQLDKDEAVKLQYFNVLKGKVVTTVYKGKIQLSLSYLDKKENWVLTGSKDTNALNYNFVDSKVNYDWDPILLSIKNVGQDNAEYSVHIVRDDNPQLNSFLIKSGVLTYASIKEKDQFCLRGYFSGPKEKIHVSMSKDEESMLKDIIPKVYVEDRSMMIDQIIVHNIMEITVKADNQHTIQEEKKFMVCLGNIGQKRVDLRVIQSGKTSQLDVNRWSLSSIDQIFTVRPKKEALFDILACDGDVQYSINTQFDQLENPQKPLKFLDSVQRVNSNPTQTNHALYYDGKSQQIFLKLKSTGSIIKWLQVDREKEMGVGYVNYQIGEMTEFVGSENIQITWEPLKATTNTSTKIHEVNTEFLLLKPQKKLKLLLTVSYCQKQSFLCWKQSSMKASINKSLKIIASYKLEQQKKTLEIISHKQMLTLIFLTFILLYQLMQRQLYQIQNLKLLNHTDSFITKFNSQELQFQMMVRFKLMKNQSGIISQSSH